MKTKHTPGPWKVEKHAGSVDVWNQNTHIATMNLHTNKHFKEFPAEDKANAALIAMAPEMLETLELCLGAIATNCEATRARVLEVIAKAKGTE